MEILKHNEHFSLSLDIMIELNIGINFKEN